MPAVRQANLPHGGVCLQLIETGVHFIKTDGAVDQAVDWQAALLVQVDKAGNVAHRYATAHVAAADRFFLADQITLFE